MEEHGAVLVDLDFMQGLLLEPLVMLVRRTVLGTSVCGHEGFLDEELHLLIFHLVCSQGDVDQIVEVRVLDHLYNRTGVYLLGEVAALGAQLLDGLKELVPHLALVCNGLL